MGIARLHRYAMRPMHTTHLEPDCSPERDNEAVLRPLDACCNISRGNMALHAEGHRAASKAGRAGNVGVRKVQKQEST